MYKKSNNKSFYIFQYFGTSGDLLGQSSPILSSIYSYWLLVKVLHPTRHKMSHFRDIPKPISWLGMEKQNHTFINEKKCTTTQQKHKKIKPGLVASYDIRPGNGEGQFLFRRIINMSSTYLLRQLPTYLQPRTNTGPYMQQGPSINPPNFVPFWKSLYKTSNFLHLFTVWPTQNKQTANDIVSALPCCDNKSWHGLLVWTCCFIPRWMRNCYWYTHILHLASNRCLKCNQLIVRQNQIPVL